MGMRIGLRVFFTSGKAVSIGEDSLGQATTLFHRLLHDAFAFHFLNEAHKTSSDTNSPAFRMPNIQKQRGSYRVEGCAYSSQNEQAQFSCLCTPLGWLALKGQALVS
jgi:hypothetical protein